MLGARRIRVLAAVVVFVAGAAVAFAAGGGSGGVSLYSTSTVTVTSENSPVISSTNPTGGCVGEVVAIIGKHFTGATAVDFNGTPAKFKVINDKQIRATVPVGFTP